MREWAHLQNNNSKGGGIMVNLDLTSVNTRQVTLVTGLLLTDSGKAGKSGFRWNYGDFWRVLGDC